MDYEIGSLTASEVLRYREEIVRIYRQAFKSAPYYKSKSEVASFHQSLGRHIKRPGLNFLIARNLQTSQFVGFTYGYSGQAGQWWHDIVANAMDSQAASVWMRNNFELVELAVIPSHQGYGIGGALHDRLLSEQRHPKAILSTLQSETIAFRLYRDRGWKVLIKDLIFPGSSRVYTIMGIDLHP